LADVGKWQRIPSEQEMELARLRRELAEIKQERDLLKRFAAYFAKESR
jgi:transposase